MKPLEWEQTVQKIVAESNKLHPKTVGKRRMLTEWRAKLEQEPTLLSPHQIDMIIREVRSRLESQKT